MLGNPCVAGQLAAYLEGLNSIELVIALVNIITKSIQKK
jgi:hypothetical protein